MKNKNMSDWKTVLLQDVVSVLGDGLHGTPKYDNSGQYYFINGNNLENGKIIIKNDTKLSTIDEYRKYKKNLNNRTILLSINGTLGNVAIYRGEKCILGKSACYFNVLDSVCKEFIRYFVSNYHFQKYIRVNAHGTTIKNVSLKTVREYEFNLPPLPEQKSIAAILSSLDSKIENLRQQNQTLEKIAQTLFKHWFVDFEFPNNDGKPYKSSGSKMIDSELGLIPEGWRIGKLSDFVIHITESINPALSPEILFSHYSIPSFDDDKQPKKELGKFILSNKYIVKPNSILISKLNPNTPRVWDILALTNTNSICSTEFQVIFPPIIFIMSLLVKFLNSLVPQKN